RLRIHRAHCGPWCLRPVRRRSPGRSAGTGDRRAAARRRTLAEGQLSGVEPIGLDIAVEVAEGEACAWVVGVLDLYTAPRLREAMVELLAGRNEPFVVNLDVSGLDFIDSSSSPASTRSSPSRSTAMCRPSPPTKASAPDVCGEPLAAAVGTEPVVTPVARGVRRRVGDLHLHPADGVDGVARAAAQPVPVAVEPVEDGEQGEERDVEERRVVPL